MEHKSRIELTDNLISVITKMSDGNPGAAVALMEIYSNTEKIDPDNMLGGLGNILMLDTFGIYGSDIYILFSDICEKDLPKMLAVLRGTQLGYFSAEKLRTACSKQDRTGRSMVPVEELYEKVKDRLPNFDTKQNEEIPGV